MPSETPIGVPAIPLARWAERQLRRLQVESGASGLSGIDAATLMGERGSNNGYTINGRTSAGLGGSRLLRTRDDGWFALTLIRDVDRELLPALFQDADFDWRHDGAIEAAVLRFDCSELLARGRMLGLPVASADETPASPAVEEMTRGAERKMRQPSHRPLVIDLSAIWAGPLAGHLFWLMGMDVIKVESPTRPDLIRRDDPATFDLINQGKASVLLDLAVDEQKSALVDLIHRADIVIESARPRALRHLGIDADALVRDVPGLIWLSVTGHGATGEAANWVGIGNDCGVSGGLSRALAETTGEIGFVGDAIADPLTGITAALEGWRALERGNAVRIGLSMSAITARALTEERAYDHALLTRELRDWGAANGAAFPRCVRRMLQSEVRSIGADTDAILRRSTTC